MIPAERGSPLINRALSLFDNNDTFAEKADVLASPWLGLAAPPDGLARVRTKGVPPCVLSPRAADYQRLARQHASNHVLSQKRVHGRGLQSAPRPLIR